MEDYKGYFISGSAVPTYLTGRQSKSLGIVLKVRAAWVRVDEYEAMGKKMDTLARRFAETLDQEVRKQILAFSSQHIRMTR